VFLCQPKIDRNNVLEENSNPQPREPAGSEAMDCPDPPREPMSNVEDTQQIIDLENRVKILKQQVITPSTRLKDLLNLSR
jgi:hypothetical protein